MTTSRNRIAKLSLAALTSLSVVTSGAITVPTLVAPAAAQGETTSVTKDGTTLTVTKNVTKGGKITVSGTGWTDYADGGSSIAVKLHYVKPNGQGGTYQRTTDVVNHPVNGNPEPTIWAYFNANADGTFTKELDLPTDLEAGQKLYVNAASSLGRDNDKVRSITATDLVVEGQPWAGEEEEKIDCKTDLSYPQITVADKANADNTLTIEGKGYCNDINGGAIVAFKLDNGSIQRLDDSVDSNRTTWYKVTANPHNGTFKINMPLPNGTTSGELGSKPAFTPGVHSVRVLSGSLKVGDPVATFPAPTRPNDNRFVVGEYKPNANPEPVNASRLVDSNKNLTITKEANQWVVTVPNGKQGQWVYPSLFLDDGSQQASWSGKFFQLDANKQFKLPITGVDLFPEGNKNRKLLVQNMDFQDTGSILGWGAVDVTNTNPTPTPTPTPTPKPDNGSSGSDSSGSDSNGSDSSGSSSNTGLIALISILGIGGLIAAVVGYLHSIGQLRF